MQGFFRPKNNITFVTYFLIWGTSWLTRQRRWEISIMFFLSPSTRNNVIFAAGLTFDIGLFHFFVFLPLLCDIQLLVMWHLVMRHLVMTPPTLVGIPHSGFLSPSLDRGIPTQVEAGTKHDVITWINKNGSVMMCFWRKLPQIYMRSKLVFSS